MTNTIRLWRRTFITLSHDYGSMLHASYAILGHLRKSWYVSGVMGEQDEGQCGSVSKEKNPKGGGYDRSLVHTTLSYWSTCTAFQGAWRFLKASGSFCLLGSFACSSPLLMLALPYLVSVLDHSAWGRPQAWGGGTSLAVSGCWRPISP